MKSNTKAMKSKAMTTRKALKSNTKSNATGKSKRDGACGALQAHAEQIGDTLRQHPSMSSIVLGSDFNSEPGESLSQLEAASFLRSMRRAANPAGDVMTCMGKRGPENIDHIYLTKNQA